MQSSDIERIRSNITQNVREHRGWYIFQGFLFILLGILALILPGLMALSFELFIGILLLVGGVFGFITCFKGELPWWSFITALVAVIIGFVMVTKPLVGLIALSLLVTIFLVIRGIADIALAFQFRPLKSWGWFLVSGIISLILAFIAWSEFPASSIMVLGIIIGVNLLLYGISLLALTWDTK